jgi:hypothetical protein
MRNWIPINERQPEQGFWCLVYSWRGVMIASFWGSNWAVFQHERPGIRIDITDVSHWMPLLEPPSAQFKGIDTTAHPLC